jgi:glycolate oxidase iron-sulfur subunit
MNMNLNREREILSERTKENIYHCNKCGLCLSSCPVYNEVLIESVSPRGKVQLSKHILEGDLDLSNRIKEILSMCLMCGSCVSACPSGVHGDQLFSGLRWKVTREYGIDWKKRIIFQILSRRWMTSSSAIIAGWAREWFGRWGGDRLKIRGISIDRLPSITRKPFSQTIKEHIEAEGKKRARFLYFHGCATNYLYQGVGRAVTSVLPSMGVELYIPKNQGCCGIPIILSGAREASMDVMRNVIQDFARDDFDGVIVDCATCGVALSKEYPYVISELKELGFPVDEELIQKAQILSSRTKDIMEFIGEHEEWLPECRYKGDRIRVTYHDPCHLLKGQGIGALPRKVIKGLPFVEFIEMEGADACCGGGGSFIVEHPDISRSIAQKKLESIKKTEARVVATGCPGCRLTIYANLDKGSSIEVLHPVELVAISLGKGMKSG